MTTTTSARAGPRRPSHARSAARGASLQRPAAGRVGTAGAALTFECVKHTLRLTEYYRRSRTGDRKSTRLNSSHSQISYAVFCLKKTTYRPDNPEGLRPPEQLRFLFREQRTARTVYAFPSAQEQAQRHQIVAA